MFRLVAICLATVVFAAAVFPVSARAGQDELAYAIFLRVNGRPITQDHVAQVMRYLLKREFDGEPPADESQMVNLQNAAIRDLVRAQLITSEANRLNIKLDRDTSRRAIGMSGLRPDEVTPILRRILEADDLFEEIMMAEGTPVRHPSPKQVRDFYNDNRESFRMDAYIIVRTIFIGEDGIRPQSFFKEQAEAIMRNLEAVPLSERTAAFAKAARESSQDVFAEFGGKLTGTAEDPWMPQDFNNKTPDGRDLFPKAMVDGIKNLHNKGELRLAISEDGMHILYLEDLRGGNVMPWDEAKRIIEFHLTQRQRAIAMRNWINRIYDRSDVKWHDGTAYEKSKLTEVLLPSERGLRPN